METPAAPNQEIINECVLNAHANLARVRELVEQDPGLINACAVWDETPLQAASHMGNREIAGFLLARGAPLDFFAAVMLGDAEAAQGFLQQEPGLASSRGVHGMPSLYFAAIAGRTDMAELLITHGADVNDGNGGNTALHAAARIGHAGMARWLLKHGADANALDYEGKTPLTVATEADHEEVADVLRDAGAAP